MNISAKKVALALGLTGLSSATMAQPALQQLQNASGLQQVAAVPAAAHAPADTPLHAPDLGKDVLAGCTILDALPYVRWELPQAASLVNDCLQQSYPRLGALQSRVRAEPGVEGIKIIVEGTLLLGDSVLLDLGYSLAKRDGKLLSYDVMVVDKRTALRKDVR